MREVLRKGVQHDVSNEPPGTVAVFYFRIFGCQGGEGLGGSQF